MTIRTRFAPSPTGHLHVGGARTAVLNWLVARHHGGEFIIRLEDTDRERNLPEAEAQILEDLRWLGVDWDEGPDRGGPFAPYRQSERLPIYHRHVERLLAEGRAYRCACPPAPAEAPGSRSVRCPCAEGGVDEGPVRFRVPERGEVVVEDIVRGRVAFASEHIEDFVLLRSDGGATYNLAATVDDGEMRITHVIRGTDHLVNTPKQILLYEALGWELPRFAHIPLILGPDRQKLSKRHGATSVAEHRREGVLPEALVNYLSLLSWSSPSGEEVLPPERLIREMDLQRVGASDAVFDTDKLRWLSSRYIQALPLPELVERLRPWLDPDRFPIAPEVLPTAVEAIRDHLSVLSEVGDRLAVFVGRLQGTRNEARAAVFADSAATAVLGAVRERLAEVDPWTEEGINAAIRGGGKEVGARGKALFLPLRLALTGEDHGPELPKVVYVLGRERAMALLRPDEVGEAV